MTADLVGFLRARLDEEAAAARAVSGAPGHFYVSPALGHAEVWASGRVRPYEISECDVWNENGHRVVHGGAAAATEHIARHDPARVLAEIDAKRELLRQYEHLKYDVTPDDLSGVWAIERVMGLLALPYAGHPEWREEWRP